MRKPLIAGNWKMNGRSDSIIGLTNEILGGLPPSLEVAVFPPNVYLNLVVELTADSSLAVGAQNVDWRASGAFTGEIEVGMLHDIGCSMSLVGHSERRQMFGETDVVVADKYTSCLAGGITPVLCVGETLAERQASETLSVVERQIQAVIDAAGIEGIGNGIIAYEPVWAIGTGETASPDQAQEVHAAIRDLLAQLDKEVVAQTRILYGGSVKADNAEALFAEEDIDGALVGGASLKSQDFLAICQAAAEK